MYVCVNEAHVAITLTEKSHKQTQELTNELFPIIEKTVFCFLVPLETIAPDSLCKLEVLDHPSAHYPYTPNTIEESN